MADDDFSQFEVSGPVRVMSEWVPGERQTHDTQYGPDERHLVSGASAAVSPDLAEGHELHEPFELYQNGKLVGEYSYDDASYYSPGRPTSNSIERYGLPELEGPHSIKWLGKEAASNFGDYEKGANDFSQFEVQGTKQPKEDDFKQFESLGAEHPVAQQNGWNLVSWVTGLIDTAKRDYLSQKLGDLTGRQSEQSKFGTLGSDPYEERIKEVQIDPNLNAQQRDETIASIRVEQAREQQKKVAAIPQAHKDLQEAQAKVDKEHPDWKQQTIASLLTLGPNMMAGPMAPFTMAQQAIAQTYGDQLDAAVKRRKETHPGESDAESYKQAINGVSEAARAAGGSMLALGLLGDIPAFGGIFTRIAFKIGYGAATMEVGNTLAEFERNRAFKEYVDPKQELTDRIKDLDFHVKNMAIGGVFGGLHGLGGEIGRPSHVPIEDRVPIAEVPDTKEEAPKPEPKPEPKTELSKEVSDKISLLGLDENNKVHRAIASLAAKYDAQGVNKFVISAGKADDGTIIVSELGHDDIANKAAKQGLNPDDLRLGFLTNKGKFYRSDETVNMTGESADIRDAAREERKVELQKAASEPPVTGTDPWLSQIANRYVEPRVEAGEIGAVTPGKGTSPQAQLARGLQMGPEEIAQHVSDLMQDKGNFRDHAAAVRAEEARLSQQSAQLSRIAEANPTDQIAQRNAEDAFKYLTDFHNGPVAKLKNQWHAAGEAMQGQVEVDLGSFNGLREQWLRDVGKEPTKDVQAKMRDTARKVREAQAAEQNAMKTLSDEIEKQTARRRLPTEEQVRKNILARMNGDNPCGL